MYRQYENARALERRVEKLRELMNKVTDIEERYNLYLKVAELEDRINFAWQDEEEG